MVTHSLKMTQLIPAPVDEIWKFFSSAGNLSLITPPSLGLKVLSTDHEQNIFAGQLIEYRVRPLLGIPVYWKTEITSVEPGQMFIDEQRKGPYKLWRHQHNFRPIEGGVEMTDWVQYKNPLGPLGLLANTVIVKRKLREIFTYRYYKVEELFGKWQQQQPYIGFN